MNIVANLAHFGSRKMNKKDAFQPFLNKAVLSSNCVFAFFKCKFHKFKVESGIGLSIGGGLGGLIGNEK